MKNPLTHDELLEQVERRQLGPEGQGQRALFFREVCIENRRADALSIGLWHSRGFKIEGFEAKASREDWLREYEDHQKAEPIMAVADHHWLVTNPDIVEDHELPENWGHLVSAGRRRKLAVAKAAPLLRPGSPPVDRGLLVSFLRSAQTLKYEREHEIREEERSKQRAGTDFDFEGVERRMKQAEEASERMHEVFNHFRQESGFDFLSYSPTNRDMEVLGKVAKALKQGPEGLDWLLRGIKHQEEQALEARKHLKEARKAIEGATDDG